MRKFGLITTIAGLATLAAGLLLRVIAHLDTWAWMPGMVLLTCGSALLLFSVVEGTPTQIHVLLDLDPALRDAETLAHAIRAAHPDAFAPPILRDDLGGDALGRAGFVRPELNQVLMSRAL